MNKKTFTGIIMETIKETISQHFNYSLKMLECLVCIQEHDYLLSVVMGHDQIYCPPLVTLMLLLPLISWLHCVIKVTIHEVSL